MKARIIANYLPQFHPIPENDKYWGKGFTEWTNVANAKPLFRGHYQPRIPADLGFYDLRLPETREQQAELAQDAGIEGFCYWHYWLGNGRQLLQRPFEEVVKLGKPDFPFCLCWANHDWSTRSWKRGVKDTIIAKQLYPGEEDHITHFNVLLPAFRDHRYIKVEGKLLFVIYDPYHFENIEYFITLWRELANKNGLPGFYFIGMCNNTSTILRQKDGTIKHILPNCKSSADIYKRLLSLGFDGLNSFGKSRGEMMANNKFLRPLQVVLHQKLPWLPTLKYNYPKVVENFFSPEDSWKNIYPTIMPQWDRTARAGRCEGVYVNATPERFKEHLKKALEVIKDKPKEHKILFLRSWNEWGEGNYVEPDLKYGHQWLYAIKECIL